MARTISVILIFSLISTALFPQKYARVQINIQKQEIPKLIQAGIAIDHGEFINDHNFISEISEKEIDILKANNYSFQILINDLTKFYQEQNNITFNLKQALSYKVQQTNCNGQTQTFSTPKHYTYGSMGGFFKYQEIFDHLDTMHKYWPNLISTKQLIDTLKTFEGRNLYYFKISNDSIVDSIKQKPQVLFNALHHAREPNSVSQMIFFMYYLLENYNSNKEIKFLVDHTDIYFIPIVNPDGYIFNETQSPSGGGMWRKNRRKMGYATGVDLNRNYSYQWGYDDTGSSNNPSADNYRGSTPFSEAETQCIRNFVKKHKFKISLNYHTYGNLMIYPWGYKNDFLCPDSSIFKGLASFYTEENNYLKGTANQTAGYITNGDAVDWMYGDNSINKPLYSLTPETGSSNDGFWPNILQIIPNNMNNLIQNVNVLRSVHNYGRACDVGSKYVSSVKNQFYYSLSKLSLNDSVPFIISFTNLSNNLVSVGASQTHQLQLSQTINDSIELQFLPGIKNGDTVRFVLNLNVGDFTYSDSIYKIYQTTLSLKNEDLKQQKLIVNEDPTNPAIKTLTIVSNSIFKTKYQFVLYNTLGEELINSQTDFGNKEIKFDMTNYTKGVYIAGLITESNEKLLVKFTY